MNKHMPQPDSESEKTRDIVTLTPQEFAQISSRVTSLCAPFFLRHVFACDFSPRQDTLPPSPSFIFLCRGHHSSLDEQGRPYGSHFIPRHHLFNSGCHEKPTTPQTYSSFSTSQHSFELRKSPSSCSHVRRNFADILEPWSSLCPLR